MTAPTTSPPSVELTDLTKTFPGGDAPVQAVRGIDLAIPQGQIVAFLGPNGAGKTTTLDMLLGLIEPTSGQARVLGLPPRKAIEEGRVAAVLQTGGLLADLTVRESAQMIASTFRNPTSVDEVLERAGVAALAGRRVSKCSGGEQQRVRFALALLPNPDLLVLDEPTAGMDVGARRDFWNTMRADADSGRTVIFATHYLEEADAFAQRIVMIADGQVVADGTTEELRATATGRTVSVEPPEDADAQWTEAVQQIPGVSSVHRDGPRVWVTSADSDDVARVLLTRLGGRNLEITSGSLESAFLTLTSTGSTEDPR